MRFSVQSMKTENCHLHCQIPLRHTTFVSSWLENINTIPFQDVKVLPVRAESAFAEDRLRCPTAVRLKPLSTWTYKALMTNISATFTNICTKSCFAQAFVGSFFQGLPIMFDMLTKCDKAHCFVFEIQILRKMFEWQIACSKNVT